MSIYKLVYFNVKGRAEVCRFIFAQAGVKYEDKRVDQVAEWPKMKANTTSGTLPILFVDGKQLIGSLVIARFLAERFGLAGSNDIENAVIAGIVQDFRLCMSQVRFESDEKKKAQLQVKFVAN